MIALLHVPRNEITPGTNLEDLIPKKNRKKLWKELTVALSDGDFFQCRLVRPKWMTYSSFPAFFLLPCAILTFWVEFPVTLALISGLPVYLLFEWATRVFFSVEFPEGMCQVKDLAKLATSLDSRTWSKDEVYAKIRTITAEQLGIDESVVTPDARFIDDLGIG